MSLNETAWGHLSHLDLDQIINAPFGAFKHSKKKKMIKYRVTVTKTETRQCGVTKEIHAVDKDSAIKELERTTKTLEFPEYSKPLERYLFSAYAI